MPYFLQQHFAERVQAGFRCAIPRSALHDILPGEAADVDDVAASAAAQVRDRRTAAVEHAAEIRINHAAPFLMRFGLDAAEPADAGVVDEDVESPKAPDGFFHHGLDREMVAHVGGKRRQLGAGRRCRAERRFSLSKMIGLDAGDGDMHAGAKKARGNRPADAARSAGHDGNLALQ